jgi:nitrate/nitrite transport system permease protein
MPMLEHVQIADEDPSPMESPVPAVRVDDEANVLHWPKPDIRWEAGSVVLLPVVATAGLLLAWLVYSHLTGVTLPGPDKVLKESWPLIAHPFYDNGGNDLGLGWQILSSLKRVAIGYGLAAVVGVLLGILLGRVKMAYQAFDPIFQVLRTIPPLAWLPIALATFNQAQPSALFVIFVTALWPILLNTAAGVSGISRDYLQVSEVYRIRGFRFFRLVLLPAAAPFIFTGLRVGIGLAWLAIVAAEMLTGGVGVGFFLWDCWNSGHLTDIFVAVAGIGLVGLALDRAVAGVAKLLGVSAG